MTVRIVAVLALVVASMAALVPPGEVAAQEAGPQITVSPATEANPLGDTISVTGTGFAAAAEFTVATCFNGAPLDLGDLVALSAACQVQSQGPGVDADGSLSASFELSASGAQRCYPDRCDVAVATHNTFPSFIELAQAPLDFADAPPPPPNDPDFSLTVSPDVEVADGGDIEIAVLNRNPATTSGLLYLCPESLGDSPVALLNSRCDFLASTVGSADWAPTVSRSRFINEFDLAPRVDCALEACVVVYDGSGEGLVPVTEREAVPISFEGGPILTASPTADVSSGDVVSVQWDGYREAPDPSFEVVHFVGVCLTPAAANGGPVFENTCTGESVAASGSAQLELQRVIEADRSGRVINCGAGAGRCSVFFGSYYVVPGGRQLLHAEYQPLTFADPLVINNGLRTAPAGGDVSVVARDQPTADGAAAFVMVCVVTGASPTGGFALACSNDIGTVETNFDGDFDGSLVMPASFTADGAEYSCVDADCVVVFAVLGPGLQLLAGEGRPVRAVPVG